MVRHTNLYKWFDYESFTSHEVGATQTIYICPITLIRLFYSFLNSIRSLMLVEIVIMMLTNSFRSFITATTVYTTPNGVEIHLIYYYYQHFTPMAYFL